VVELEHYKPAPSLDAVVIVSHDKPHLEVWQRSDRGWSRSEARPGDSVKLAAIDCELAADGVYRGVSRSTTGIR
jgi:hypothetical protein